MYDNELKSTSESGESKAEHSPKAVLSEFRKAWEAQERFIEAAKDDALFALGNQWDPKDAKILEDAKVRPLTINQISPVLRLLKGVETQNRSDFRAYPEGEEDDLSAEIVSRLVKNMAKKSDLDYKLTEMFDAGNATGKASLEPYLEYPMRVRRDGTVDLNADICWRMRHYNAVIPDPCAVEYDDSDGAYLFKWTPDLSREQLLSIFPKKKDLIMGLKNGKINISQIPLEIDSTGVEVQDQDGDYDEKESKGSWTPKNAFDLIDRYYKHWVERWYVASAKDGAVRAFNTKDLAERFVKTATEGEPEGQESARMFSRWHSEMYCCFVTGNCDEFLYDGPAWSAPRYEGYPLFNYYAYRATFPVDKEDRELLIQGVTRGAKDSNRELNKRRTQELRHLNQSGNSGWIVEDGALNEEQEAHLRQYGGSAGVIVKYTAGHPKPEKIVPTPLSAGHSQMALEHRQDMRDTVGVNTETLAVENDQSSGRAIAARVRQGMVQVQGLFDNYGRTRRNIGRFMIAMLPKCFDVERAMRVLGSAFLQQNFQVPMQAPATDEQGNPIAGPDGKPQMVPLIDPRTGQPAMKYDENLARQTITGILEDAEIGIYDIAVGEIIAATTVMYGQFQEALELRNAGIPIPGDVLINRSSMPESDKKKTIAALAAAQANPEPAKSKEKVA